MSKKVPKFCWHCTHISELEISLFYITGELFLISRDKAKKGIFQAVGIIYNLRFSL